jgi:hypothetical protein
MKIDNQINIVPFDQTRQTDRDKKTAAVPRDPKPDSSSQNDQVDSRLSNALNSALEGISQSGITAGQVHSQMNEVVAAGLLRSSQVDSQTPRMSDEELLKMADKVVKDSQAAASQALGAFNELDPNRVAQLV